MTQTVSEVTRSWIKKIRPEARNDLKSLMRLGASRSSYRKFLNRRYSALSFAEMQHWHTQYAKIFRGFEFDYPVSDWRVSFLGREIVLPLGGVDMWLKWDAALSILGHEIEIKRIYAALIQSKFRPKLMFDIGANYGLHSLLFLAHGIRVATFEPNAACHHYFRTIAELNGVNYDLYPIALGEDESTVELSFPDSETWLGTTVPTVRQAFRVSEPISTVKVRQTTLDLFLDEKQLYPDLLKIDTEGAELNILRGGRNMLRQCRPLIIFESWAENGREELFQTLTDSDYQLFRLRQEGTVSSINGLQGFCAAPESNFLAAPSESSSSLITELHSRVN